MVLTRTLRASNALATLHTGQRRNVFPPMKRWSKRQVQQTRWSHFDEAAGRREDRLAWLVRDETSSVHSKSFLHLGQARSMAVSNSWAVLC